MEQTVRRSRRKPDGQAGQKRWADLIFLLLLVFFAFYVNRTIRIRGLYMDDLYMWSCYGEQSLLEFAFPIGTSTRFRPVYWLATYLQMAIVGTHISWFVPFNIVCNLITAFSVYYIARKFSGLSVPAFLSGLCYLASRFAYYQIGQALGLMETMALTMAIWILYLLYRYQNMPGNEADMFLPGEKSRGRARRQGEERKRLHLAGKSGSGNYVLALVLYFLLVFVHERYLALLPLFYLSFFFRMRREKAGRRRAFVRENTGLLIAPLLLFGLIMLIRRLCIGSAVPAGTGGTEVTETFRLSEAIGFALSQVLYLFGINAGPEHLCGLPWQETPLVFRGLTLLGILLLLVLSVWFLLVLVLVRGAGKSPARNTGGGAFPVQNACLFLCFIALCIGCSSVTIRVEMRWIYVSYTAALLFASEMIGVIRERAAQTEGVCQNAERQDKEARRNTSRSAALCALFLLYTVTALSCNLFYRQYYPKLYFWPDQLRMNSLAEETYEKYGKAIFGKDIYILENRYGMSDFYKDTFFKTFDPEKKAEGTRVWFIESPAEIPKEKLAEGNILVIAERPSENAYQDVTDEVLSQSQNGVWEAEK